MGGSKAEASSKPTQAERWTEAITPEQEIKVWQNVVMDSIKTNQTQKMNGLDLLSKINSETIKLAFFDPQYRGVLDKLNYGNEVKNRSKKRAGLPQMSEETILEFIGEINRVLKPSGYLMMWLDKFHLLQSIKQWATSVASFEMVDMITWNKMRMGLGYRSRRHSEYLVVVQKKPTLATATWSKRNIPDVWEEKIPNKTHPHSKPLELQKQLILATTDEGDYVLDPAAGGYSVLQACKELKRVFIGCDLVFD